MTDEQHSPRPNSAQPKGRQFFFGQTSLLAPYRSTSGYARRSRLVWPKNPLPRLYSYFGDTTLAGKGRLNIQVPVDRGKSLVESPFQARQVMEVRIGHEAGG